jgi:hypothetical protein
VAADRRRCTIAPSPAALHCTAMHAMKCNDATTTFSPPSADRGGEYLQPPRFPCFSSRMTRKNGRSRAQRDLHARRLARFSRPAATRRCACGSSRSEVSVLTCCTGGAQRGQLIPAQEEKRPRVGRTRVRCRAKVGSWATGRGRGRVGRGRSGRGPGRSWDNERASWARAGHSKDNTGRLRASEGQQGGERGDWARALGVWASYMKLHAPRQHVSFFASFP